MVRNSSTRGLVAISMAALSVNNMAANAFVQPPAPIPSLSSRQSPRLHASASIPDDKSSNKWDESKSSSSSSRASSEETNIGAADGLESLESASSIADVHAKYSTDQYDGRDGSFPLTDRSPIPETRRLRWEREALARSKFASGDEIHELRASVDELRRELTDARTRAEEMAEGSAGRRTEERRVARLEGELLASKGKDAEFAYAVSLELMEKARDAGEEEALEKYTHQMEEARLCIPQLNMHGLWVGKYGDHGYEMINVTYSGDTLIATKVTGDQNVPKGKVSFTVDLSPPSASGVAPLEPIELNPDAAKQWGKKFLPRHSGKGQVASENFANAQWMEGQLILVGRFFSFAWVPIGHQVFFGRPSAELTLKMTREAAEEELKRDQVAAMREAAEGMWGETYWADKELQGENYFSGEADESCFE